MIDLYERRCKKMNDEQLREDLKVHLVALGCNILTHESKHRTIVLLNEGLSRESMADNHDDFNITIRLLKLL